MTKVPFCRSTRGWDRAKGGPKRSKSPITCVLIKPSEILIVGKLPNQMEEYTYERTSVSFFYSSHSPQWLRYLITIDFYTDENSSSYISFHIEDEK